MTGAATATLAAAPLSEVATDQANAVYLVLVAVLVACGTYLLTDRSLTRVILGVLLLGNGANLLLLAVSGRAGGPPLTGATPPEAMSDPLPQALILTAIVITMGVAAFVLALLHRGWTLDRRDEVLDDEADILVGRREPEVDPDDGDDPADDPADDPPPVPLSRGSTAQGGGLPW